MFRSSRFGAKKQASKPGVASSAVNAVDTFFNKIAAETRAPRERRSWTRDDYERERKAIRRRLVKVSQKFAGLRQENVRLKAQLAQKQRGPEDEDAAAVQDDVEVEDEDAGEDDELGRYHIRGRSRRMLPAPGWDVSSLGGALALATAPGMAGVAIPLDGTGVYLVAEADPVMLRAHPAGAVGGAVEQAAFDALAGRAVGDWREHL
jgi:hypothetical protein